LTFSLQKGKTMEIVWGIATVLFCSAAAFAGYSVGMYLGKTEVWKEAEVKGFGRWKVGTDNILAFYWFWVRSNDNVVVDDLEETTQPTSIKKAPTPPVGEIRKVCDEVKKVAGAIRQTKEEVEWRAFKNAFPYDIDQLDKDELIMMTRIQNRIRSQQGKPQLVIPTLELLGDFKVASMPSTPSTSDSEAPRIITRALPNARG